MRKNLIIGGSIVIVISLLGVGIYASRTGNPITTKKTAAKKTQAVLRTEGFVEVPTFMLHTETGSNAQKEYAYNVSYPSIALLLHPTHAKETNVVIKTFALDILHEFEKSFDETVPQVSGALAGSGFTSDFTMKASASLLSPTIISLRFDSAEYITGSAHPNNETRILNYDIETRRILDTGDLFASSSEALPFLSAFTRRALRERFTDLSEQEFEDTVMAGVAPLRENFHRVALTKNGLLVIFNPYQVAAYARGTQEIQIPLAALSGLISERTQNAITLSRENFVEAVEEPQQMEY